MPENKTILIVENEDSIRFVYSEVLKTSGYKVLEADNGQTGYDLAKSENWDLALVDILIPKVDGVALLGLIKSDDALKDKPVIMLTNFGSERLISKSFELGADGYLIKAEITPDEILDEVENFLGE